MAKNRERKILIRWGRSLVNRYKYKLRANNVNATGKLSNVSFTTKVTESLRQDRYQIIVNIEDYWVNVEDGRRKGTFPPVDAIRTWINEKPINIQQTVLPSGKKVLPTPDQVAFLIGRKIFRDGIPERPYMAEAEAEADEKIDLTTELTNAIAQDAVDEIRKAAKGL